MRLPLTAAATLSLLLGGCNFVDSSDEPDRPAAEAKQDTAGEGDGLASNDPAPGQQATITIPDSEPRPIMQAQVVLERAGFAPGVIDGKMGISTKNALKGFQESRGLSVTGELDEATKQALSQWQNIPATRIVTIPESWAQETFMPVPDDPAEQAKMQRLGYADMAEKLAERFHTTPAVLAQLNPGGRPAGAKAEAGASGAPAGGATAKPASTATAAPSPTPSPSGSAAAKSAANAPQFRPGQEIRVPNIGGDRIAGGMVEDATWLQTLQSLGVGTEQPQVTRLVVDESEGWLKAYGEDDKLVAMFTVTTGSKKDPLPIGNWTVKGVAHNPPYAFNPEILKNVPDSEEKQELPPGPNSPVGVVWIDLSKEHYGIHGTPSPETIGRAESNGCVRLTNWDAARLALMVKSGTKVVFQK